MNTNDPPVVPFEGLWTHDRTLYANTEDEALAAAESLYNEFVGRRLRVNDAINGVQAFLRCRDCIDSALFWCEHLSPYGDPGDPGDAHDISRPGGLVVEIVGASELMGGGWDDEQGVVYPQWDVEITDTDGLLCDGKPIDVCLIDNPWLGLPGIGRPE